MEQFETLPQPALIVKRPPECVGAAYTEAAPQYYALNSGAEVHSGDLLEYWRIARRHKTSLFLFAICGMLLGILAGLPQKAIYKVSTSIEVLNLNEDFMNMKQTNPTTSSDESYDTSEEQTQVKLLQSDSLLERVVLILDPSYPKHSYTLPVVSGWRKLLNSPEPVRLTERQALLNRMTDTLKVKSVSRTRVIEVTLKSTDPKLAVAFANALANEFIEQNIEARWKTTQRVGDWLSRELNDERANLLRSEDALQKYARESGLIFTDDNTNVATEKLQQLQQQLTAMTGDRIGKQSRYELAQHSPPDSLPDVVNDDNLRESAAKINDLRRQIADLSAIFTPDYSKVKRLEAELNALNVAFQTDRTNVIDRIKNEYQEALRKEQLLASDYDRQTQEVTGQDEKAIQYNTLKREVDSHRQLYDRMLQQTKQSSIAAALHASNLRIVDPAELPDQPIWPNFKILSFAGFTSGLFLGIAVIMVRERADRSLQQPGDVQLWTKLPELGTIPNASVDGKRRRSKHSRSAEARRKENSFYADKGPSVELITWNSKPSLMAEAFRSTLTSILFVGENGSRPTVLVATSANASDGKTTVVTNLGIAIAEARRSVLLLDADLRRPRVHELFGLSNEHGLSDLLGDQVLSDARISALIQKTEIPGLDIIASGPSTHAAANLLYSPNLAELVARLKKRYDMVLIDTPPMLHMTDARVIGRLADAVVLVARAEQTTRDAIVAASQRLSEDGIRVLGTILNDWDPNRSLAGPYGYYKTGYYYAEKRGSA
jgi:succinoglycan biosynthesis transport protein ExoP